MPEHELLHHVAIIGLGATGTETARFLKASGTTVSGFDRRRTLKLRDESREWFDHLYLGEHDPELLAGIDAIVISPGVDPRQPFFAEARNRGIPILSEIELAFCYAQAPVMAVTGTNGKTTVVELLNAIFQEANISAFAGGNLGDPFVHAVQREAAGEAHYDWYLLEVSSFQLEGAQTFRPRIALLLNVEPDHLDRYADLDEYGATKWKLLSRMGTEDTAIVNVDNPWLAERLAAEPPVCRIVRVSREQMEGELWRDEAGHTFDLAALRLLGEHNRENVRMAVAAARAAGVDEAAIERAVNGFEGLPHRLQPVAELNGVRWINDSKATNVAATRRAVSGIDGPLHLILGGLPKGDDFTLLLPLFAGREVRVYTIGQAADSIRNALEGHVPLTPCSKLESAVEVARRMARPGDTVLFSPACASFDQFSDYAERGRAFIRAVTGDREAA